MAEHEGPWHRPQAVTPNAPIAQRWRVAIWVGAMVAIAGAVGGLMYLYPGQVAGGDKTIIWYDVAFVALISSRLVLARGTNLRDVGRNVALWGLIALVLSLGFTFRGDLAKLGMRLRAEVIPGAAISSTPHVLTVNASDDGHFYVMGAVNGVSVRFLIDTGASDITLGRGDAERAGIATGSLKFDQPYGTANGVGHGAGVTLDSLTAGTISFSKVRVSVNEADMPQSLLGMSFLKRLESYDVRDHKLTLRWHG